MPDENVSFGQKVKNNPIKTAISILTLLSMIVTGVLWVDTRYIKAGDMQQFSNQQQKAVQNVEKMFIQHAMEEINRQIFAINFKINNNQADALDHAMLDQLRAELRKKEMELNKLSE